MSGCEGYEAIPKVYERLNSEIDYEGWADFFEACFDRYLPERPGLVLDLACGTGSMTRTLARRGYDMIGVDGSENMLAQAYAASEGGRILYLLQDMRSFELYGTVGAVTCCLDSVNYLLTPEDVKKTFSGVHNYLDPDGLFLFDVNTPAKLEGLDGQVFLDETEDTYCVWRTEFDEKKRLCYYGMDIFRLEGEHWQRSFEEHIEYAYEPAELQQWLAEAGFTRIRSYGDRVLRAPKEAEQRIYFSAKKE